MTVDGDFYANYKESLAPELVENWIRDRWCLIKKMAIIIIEKHK